ncbi:MAG: hypothetical protein ABUT39_14155 [Acidobacteriota bacterium]
MSFSRPGPFARRWIYAWLLLIAPAWALGLVADVEMFRWAESTPDMCQGLPDYGAVARDLPLRGTIGFFSEVPDPTNSERFFCAQYDLAPRVLARWRPEVLNLSQRQLAGTTLLLSFADRSAMPAFLRDLDAEAKRQGVVATRRDLSKKLTLITFRARARG